MMITAKNQKYVNIERANTPQVEQRMTDRLL